MISFVLDDTHQAKNGQVAKENVAELITEINSLEGVAKFILGEIENIKSSSEQRAEDVTTDNKFAAPKLGRKLDTSSVEH